MKQLLLIKSHSFVDIITNSSTELFVCNTDKSVKMIKEILEDKWRHFCALYEKAGSLSDILEIKIVTKDDVREAEQKRKEKYGFWLDEYFDGYKEGDIYVIGASDNSIPYEFFDIIENTFNATSYHLG